MSRRLNERRLRSRAAREAETPGGGSQRPKRQRPQRTGAEAKTASRFNFVPVLIAIGVIGLIGLLSYAVLAANDTTTIEETGWNKAQLNDDPKLPGTYYEPHPGADGTISTDDDRRHFDNGTVVPICTQEQIDSDKVSDPLCYTSNPPTSGPHASSPMPFGVLQNPARKENLIHNMEHGGVVVWYNTDDQSLIDQLKDAVEEETGRRKLVVMSKYTEMEPNTIALTSWTRLDKFSTSEFSKKRVIDFIEEHSRRFNPEGL